MTETIKMRRDEPTHEGAPVEADVHPDEVENWKSHGWRIVEEAKPEPKAPKTAKAPKPKPEE
jgi:hypothetical protein